MNYLSLAVLGAMLANGVAAVSWQQFFNSGCSGTVENSGSFTGNGSPPVSGAPPQHCVAQQGASVNFAKSGGVSCSLFIFNDPNCDDFAFDVGDGCYNFGSSGHSFGISC
jgi:hypothetical protein